MSLFLIQSPWVTPSWVSKSYLERCLLPHPQRLTKNPSRRGPPLSGNTSFSKVSYFIYFPFRKAGVQECTVQLFPQRCPAACLTGPGVQIVFVFSFKYLFFLVVWYNWTNGIVPKPHSSGNPGRQAQMLKIFEGNIWKYLNPGKVLPVTVHYLTQQD